MNFKHVSLLSRVQRNVNRLGEGKQYGETVDRVFREMYDDRWERQQKRDDNKGKYQ